MVKICPGARPFLLPIQLEVKAQLAVETKLLWEGEREKKGERHQTSLSNKKKVFSTHFFGEFFSSSIHFEATIFFVFKRNRCKLRNLLLACTPKASWFYENEHATFFPIFLEHVVCLKDHLKMIVQLFLKSYFLTGR